jgi:FMN phosphatase YigB (HAD superfamily)
MLGYIITDIDNTLYDYFELSNCFRAMIHVLSKETGISEDIITEDYSSVFQQHGTIEYPYPTQELFCFNEFPQEKVEYLTNLALKVFSRSYRKRLKLYDGVEDTLKKINDAGWILIGVTNAPLYRASSRLKRKGVLKYFSLLSGRQFEEVKSSKFVSEDLVNLHREKYQRVIASMDKIGIKSFSVPPELLKPDPTSFKSALNYISEKENKPLDEINIVAIGDNLINDLYPLKGKVTKLIWAKYGVDLNEKDKDTMVSFTKWQNKERKNLADIIPDQIYDVSIDSFSELIEILNLEVQLDFNF